MSEGPKKEHCGQGELLPVYVLGALPRDEARRLEAHLAECVECQQELRSLRPLVDSFAEWPVDILRPPESLWSKLQHRIGEETVESGRPEGTWRLPEWEDVAPGICCRLLATDEVYDRITMLVRLAPGAAYPPHRHAGAEELFLLSGELWIEDRKLHPGDYNRADPGSADRRVWSETGCTCILITSPSDVIL